MDKSIRVKADLNANSANLVVNLSQNFDFLEVLSLRLNSDEVYRLHNSNYGVLVGRVSTNGGFGIPNAKISVFIPITDEDDSNIYLKSFYNFKTPYDKGVDGVRYNLLPKEKQSTCHTPVGTFPDKIEILDNEIWVEVYEKYYKYNTVTNTSGDYMIVGIPVGSQNIHLDVDLSDIGFVSLRPYDLIAQGTPPSYFNSFNKFKQGKDLDALPQIQSVNQGINIIPFWGDKTINEIGITQLNFNLPLDITPHATFFGAIFTDDEGKRINRRCRPNQRVGDNCSLKPSRGSIEMIRKVSDTIDGIEYFPINSEIDENGNFTTLVPMNLKRVVTDELGNIVLSSDPNKGLPTSSKVRFRISSDNFNYKFFKGVSRAGSFLVPNLYNRFQFGAETHDDDFFEVYWKKIYTVSQYIPNYARGNFNNLSIKNVEQCDSNYPFPYNRVELRQSPVFAFLSAFISVFTTVVKAINLILPNDITLNCNGEELDPETWSDCQKNNLANALGLVNYSFFNDWVSGCLYAPAFAYKVKNTNGDKKWEKYCDFDCDGQSSDNPLNNKNKCRNAAILESTSFKSSGKIDDLDLGLIFKYDEFFYYAARHDIAANLEDSVELTPSEKRKLLLATNLMELGSMVSCDLDNVPYIIKDFSPTTYDENDAGDLLFNVEGVGPRNVNRNALQLKSQISTEEYSSFNNYELQGNFSSFPEYDSNTNGNTEPVGYNRLNIELRRYLCENWKYFDNILEYNNYINNDLDPSYFREFDDETGDLEDVAEFNYDECIPCTQNEQHKKIHPYYFYFGLVRGSNALDNLLKKYFNDCD